MNQPSSPATSNPLVMGLHFQLLKRAGSLISSLDGLRTELAGVSELAFPQIIVVGEETSGKSSVLERIAMLRFFPRGDHKCTRMPIKLQLKHTSVEDMKQLCRESGKEATEGIAFVRTRMEEKGGKPGPWSNIVSVDQVEQLVQDSMSQAVHHRNGANKGVVEDVIAVEVKSALVPNLTLIDLPGTCVNPRPGEPEDIMERTQALVEAYLAQEHTLVLLVLPALTRIHNYLPIKLINKHRKADVTVGVLTKADLAESNRFRDKFHELKLQLNGKRDDFVDLPHGYVAVRNRDSQGEKKSSLETAAVEERDWFNEHLPGYVEAKKASNPVLVEKLVEMLCSYVSHTWVPRAVEKINEQLRKIDTELDGLGPVRVPLDLPAIFADITMVFHSASGQQVVRQVLDQAATEPLGPRARPVNTPNDYALGLLYHKNTLCEEAQRVFKEPAFLSEAIDQLLLHVQQAKDLKLARFENLLATLKLVIVERFQQRVAGALERLQRQLDTLMTIFDSKPELQQQPRASAASVLYDKMRGRVTALVRTIMCEVVLVPLEKLFKEELRDNAAQWVSALVAFQQRRAHVGQLTTEEAAKAKLVAESAPVAEKRQQLNEKKRKLGDALLSIAKLKQQTPNA